MIFELEDLMTYMQYPRLELLDWETLKIERFIPAWIECATFDFRFKTMFFIWKEGDSDVGIRCSTQIFSWELLALQRDTKAKNIKDGTVC